MPPDSELLDRANAGDHAPELIAALTTRLRARLDTMPRERLARMEEELGRSPYATLAPLLDAADPANRRAAAELLAATSEGCACGGGLPPEPTSEQEDDAAATLVRRALAPVNHLRALWFTD